MQRTPIRGRLDRDDEGRMAAPTAPGAFTGALTADIGVIDLDPRPGGAQLVAAVAFDHCLHQPLPASACAGSARQHWSKSRAAGPARYWTAPSCPERAGAWRGTKLALAAWCPAGQCRQSAMSDSGTVGIATVDAHGSHNTVMPHIADT